MKERPIIFSAPMVRTILEDRKNMTRQVINYLPGFRMITEFKPSDTPGYKWTFRDIQMMWHDIKELECPYGKPGDRLWVKETFATKSLVGNSIMSYPIYRADGERMGVKWAPSIHMPRWASRILLEITDVRVDRLQDITEEDAIAEGIKKLSKDNGRTWKYGIPDNDGLPGNDNHGWPWQEWCNTPIDAFRKLWDSINSARGYGWKENPWVWVIEFRRIEK
ncbi:MAG: hypothetical protein LBQ81_08225 [Zoogloeaceae bacterium]|jgi:hypothetical protein|nr:hypothetical protein [Zoogloeaceae bacterium]